MASGYRGITAGAGSRRSRPGPYDSTSADAVEVGHSRPATRTIHDEQDLPSPGSSPRVPQSGLEGIPLKPEDEKARHKSPDSPFPSEHGHEVEQLPETGEGRREEVLKLADEGLTQGEIAERVGLSRSYVGRIIRAARGGE